MHHDNTPRVGYGRAYADKFDGIFRREGMGNMTDQEQIEQLTAAGHPRHCACRQVWGDGECECDLYAEGYDPYAWTRIKGREGMECIEREREKYRKMWAHPQYRVCSPGEGFAPQAIESLGMLPGETVYDLGAGTGRGGVVFSRHGMGVTLVDIVDANETQLPHITACLWRLNGLPPADYVFCSDVMEHIPEAHVGEVLANAARLCRKGAFFSIHMAEDTSGRMVGETLHLTVRPSPWWLDRIGRWFDVSGYSVSGVVLAAWGTKKREDAGR